MSVSRGTPRTNNQIYFGCTIVVVQKLKIVACAIGELSNRGSTVAQHLKPISTGVGWARRRKMRWRERDHQNILVQKLRWILASAVEYVSQELISVVVAAVVVKIAVAAKWQQRHRRCQIKPLPLA